MASIDCFLEGLLLCLLFCVASAHRLLLDPQAYSVPGLAPSSNHDTHPYSHHDASPDSHQPAYPPSTSHHDAYPDSRQPAPSISHQEPAYPPTSHHDAYPNNRQPAYPPSTSHHHAYPDSRQPTPSTSHEEPVYPPSTSHHDVYPNSRQPAYPPANRRSNGYILGSRPHPASPPTPRPSASPTSPPSNLVHDWSITSSLAAAPSPGDHELTWTYKPINEGQSAASAPLADVDSGNIHPNTPVIWPDLGEYASQLSFVYEEPPPSKKNN